MLEYTFPRLGTSVGSYKTLPSRIYSRLDKAGPWGCWTISLMGFTQVSDGLEDMFAMQRAAILQSPLYWLWTCKLRLSGESVYGRTLATPVKALTTNTCRQ